MLELKDGVILYDGSSIGDYKLVDNTLYDIFLQEKYRNKGYGSRIMRNLCDVVRSRGYNFFRVVGVISEPMEKVLKNNKFKKNQDILSNELYNINEYDNLENSNTWIKLLDT